LGVKEYIATGRRKESTATAHLKDGVGKIVINGKPMEEYFGRKVYHTVVKTPLVTTSTINNYDIMIDATGGGTTGQAEAIRLAIARALILANPKFRAVLKKAGLLTRDARAVERKKYGRPKARKRFQFSKR